MDVTMTHCYFSKGPLKETSTEANTQNTKTQTRGLWMPRGFSAQQSRANLSLWMPVREAHSHFGWKAQGGDSTPDKHHWQIPIPGAESIQAPCRGRVEHPVCAGPLSAGWALSTESKGEKWP